MLACGLANSNGAASRRKPLIEFRYRASGSLILRNLLGDALQFGRPLPDRLECIAWSVLIHHPRLVNHPAIRTNDGWPAHTPRTTARPIAFSAFSRAVAFRASTRTGASKAFPFAVAQDADPCGSACVTISGLLAEVAIFPPIRHLVRP